MDAPRDPETPDVPESLIARLRKRYGGDVDPEVSPGGDEPQSPGDVHDELLQRFASKAPRYKLEGEVARGGMATILRVWDQDLRRHLAMKVVLEKSGAADAGAAPRLDTRVLARFLEEAQVTGQLDHPGIVPVHELGLDADGRFFFTMKLVKGRELKAIFDLVFQQEEGWTETRALSLILRVCEAMAYAHAKGVIHRDLKPANVMVGNFGEVFVMDWGLARVLGRKDSHDLRLRPEGAPSSLLTSVKTERSEEREDSPDSPIVTMDGDVMGTPAYMPPEQARGEIEKLSPGSDVYSIGAMLYHLLAKQMPYVPPGVRMTNRTVLALVLEGPPRPLHELNRSAHAELVAICEKAMAREAKDRYADTLALAEDLRAYLEQRVVGAYETGAWAETKKWVARNKPLAASLAAGIAVLVLGICGIAVKNAKLADATAAARANEGRAIAGEALATQKANDVLSLSAIQDLKDLEDRADALWPADPEMLPQYEAWLADARDLIQGHPTDPARGVKKRPSLAEHEAKLAELRARAKPLTPEQADADRKASPGFAEWEKEHFHLQWMRRMLGEEPWPAEAEVESDVAKETLPADANALNNVAWRFVNPDPAKIVYGNELRGLVLARRAFAAAKDSDRPGIRDTVGWALYRCGRFDEAVAEEELAVDDAVDQQKEALSASMKDLRRSIAEWKTDEDRAKRADDTARLSAHVADLERLVSERRTIEFASSEDNWWHLQLAKLVSDLHALTDEARGGLFSSGTSERHGWGIAKRAEFARTIDERSVSSSDAKKRWGEAITAIAKNPRYRGLEMTPQIGLLPIGEDPDSHLWEFSHLATGDPAERGADGRLVLREEMGLVFVLIPGGTFRMGTQKNESSGPNYDPLAREDESPVHEVTLSPYFLSKYEMTQGQWERFTGRNPSNYTSSTWSPTWNREGKGWNLLHPVELVTWTQCMDVTSRLGLSLPSEAQWENGARGGTETVYWSGEDIASLRDVDNVADAYGKSHGADSWPAWEKDLDDGNSVHAEIGSYRPNPFGLHDVHGNVWEWCLDGYDPTFYASGPREDPVSPWAGASSRVLRGGSFLVVASSARVAIRSGVTPEIQYNALGLRPSRALRRSPSSHQVAGR